ncbi:hypothetical protein NPIL_435501 [Nephila pilipes]|uniref:Uncharacterized protein n=1 Tax=Nephila pilipes TaxID=299642 RepID=A0A8X6UJY3_NEPPI|nr:hypothetical protein NPIL_435501 [Nephila pilipes]
MGRQSDMEIAIQSESSSPLRPDDSQTKCRRFLLVQDTIRINKQQKEGNRNQLTFMRNGIDHDTEDPKYQQMWAFYTATEELNKQLRGVSIVLSLLMRLLATPPQYPTKLSCKNLQQTKRNTVEKIHYPNKTMDKF